MHMCEIMSSKGTGKYREGEMGPVGLLPRNQPGPNGLNGLPLWCYMGAYPNMGKCMYLSVSKPYHITDYNAL